SVCRQARTVADRNVRAPFARVGTVADKNGRAPFVRLRTVADRNVRARAPESALEPQGESP
ncbi:MAG: hypothetical protein WCT12_29285, partial [Verrucomicrobiota bacterium]